MFELSQTFTFDAAHTLKRQVSPEEAAGSRRIHGHTYTAEVIVAGDRQPDSGMVVDLAVLREVIAGIRSQLDHHFLDEVAGLGAPTLENLCVFIYAQARQALPQVAAVSVSRAAGDRCTYRPRA
ncbi:6-carboxytetrahydropterin synthase [Aquabacterium fontiphilum]|jgi:6-pyruvoyltetrahydropterin/6-carboxytetrahydropterin synthase|uniref:6-carboxytetrahydropterin synthase n=1 Tax=Aquabacterium fontiphilum TaxID=450365 RepID=UPI001378F401|nr:6-carboxytetrahydropterin synthase [Aquabacterium fontiphilum]NBD20550.1 6-carboxytetrahydropterin synthase [Aquabacterium fontiphilum]